MRVLLRSSGCIERKAEGCEMVEERDPPLRDRPADRDVDMVLDIRIICRLIKETAEYVGTHDPADEILNEERKRYLIQKEKALKLAKCISDDFYRAVAFREVIVLCVTANDSDAKDLLRDIGVVFIRDKIIETYPGLLSNDFRYSRSIK
jgi:hypothetical protein